MNRQTDGQDALCQGRRNAEIILAENPPQMVWFTSSKDQNVPIRGSGMPAMPRTTDPPVVSFLTAYTTHVCSYYLCFYRPYCVHDLRATNKTSYIIGQDELIKWSTKHVFHHDAVVTVVKYNCKQLDNVDVMQNTHSRFLLQFSRNSANIYTSAHTTMLLYEKFIASQIELLNCVTFTKIYCSV